MYVCKDIKKLIKEVNGVDSPNLDIVEQNPEKICTVNTINSHEPCFLNNINVEEVSHVYEAAFLLHNRHDVAATQYITDSDVSQTFRKTNRNVKGSRKDLIESKVGYMLPVSSGGGEC